MVGENITLLVESLTNDRFLVEKILLEDDLQKSANKYLFVYGEKNVQK